MIQIYYANENAHKEVNSLPKDLRAHLKRITDLINEYGLARVGMPHIRYLGDELWEIRLRDAHNIARSGLC